VSVFLLDRLALAAVVVCAAYILDFWAASTVDTTLCSEDLMDVARGVVCVR